MTLHHDSIHEIILSEFQGDKLPRLHFPWQVHSLEQYCIPDCTYALCYSWQAEMPVLALYQISPWGSRAFPRGRFMIAFALPARINNREVTTKWACEALEERENQEDYEKKRRFIGLTEEEARLKREEYAAYKRSKLEIVA